MEEVQDVHEHVRDVDEQVRDEDEQVWDVDDLWNRYGMYMIYGTSMGCR